MDLFSTTRSRVVAATIAAIMLCFGFSESKAQRGPFECFYGYDYIRLYSPTTNGTYTRGQQISFSWYSGWPYAFYYYGATMVLEYSSDGGANWTKIQDGINGWTTTSYNWTIPASVQPGTNYYFRIYEQPGNTGSWYCTFNYPSHYWSTNGPNTILRGCFPPKVSTQPTPRSACITTSTTFTVASDLGKSPGTYVWRKNGTPIATTTDPTFTLNNLTTASAGDYDVVITDACSSTATVTSAAATLTILEPPVIKTQPAASLTVCQFGVATMKISATGPGVTFQWRKDGVDIAGARDSVYVIANTLASSIGTYTCMVSGTCSPSVLSTGLALNVIQRPIITANPQSITLCPGAAGQLSCAGTGQTLLYQWYKNDAVIPGATSPIYSIGSYNASYNGSYYCAITSSVPNPNNCTVTLYTTPAFVSGYVTPQLVAGPQATEACAGKSISLASSFVGPDLNYKWYRNGVLVPNANSNELNITMAKPSDAGTYRVTATSTCNLQASSQDAVVTVVTTPAFTLQPMNKHAVTGERVELSAMSPNAAHYQWYRNNVAIKDANQATYVIAAASSNDQGYYRVTIDNSCGALTSGSAQLTVTNPLPNEPRLNLAYTTKDLGEIPVGYNKTEDLTEVITNTGSADLEISSVTSSSTDFIVESPTSAVTLQPNGKTTLRVRAEGTMVGARTGTITIASNATPATSTIDISSMVVLRYAVPNSFSFADTREDSTRESCFKISNTSNMNITIDDITASGADGTSFAVVTARPLSIPANGQADLCLKFAPGSDGAKSGMLMFTSPTGGNTSMTLDGKGTQIPVSSVEDDALVASVSAYPNPASDVVKIVAPGGASISIINVNGTKVASLNVPETGSSVSWNTRNAGNSVAAGSYTIVVTSNGATAKLPLMIVR